jgi:hypothetical protein
MRPKAEFQFIDFARHECAPGPEKPQKAEQESNIRATARAVDWLVVGTIAAVILTGLIANYGVYRLFA